ncbi:MAG TPA: DUF2628 domain-containing protein [Beijerinckiaceae bacterium]|nr:DUF2628 domain-containing protein [Beijerinckiaceae bacterium]
MKVYTLHVPAHAAPGDAEALDDAEFVKDGFAWGAFVFTFLWFFWHRLWLAGLAVLAAVAVLSAVLAVFHISPGASFAAGLLLSFLIGLEASSLRRWTLRKRKPVADVVTAADRDEAEAKSFARWLDRPAEQRVVYRPGSAPMMPYRRPDPVIGLFPETEQPR